MVKGGKVISSGYNHQRFASSLSPRSVTNSAQESWIVQNALRRTRHVQSDAHLDARRDACHLQRLRELESRVQPASPTQPRRPTTRSGKSRLRETTTFTSPSPHFSPRRIHPRAAAAAGSARRRNRIAGGTRVPFEATEDRPVRVRCPRNPLEAEAATARLANLLLRRTTRAVEILG